MSVTSDRSIRSGLFRTVYPDTGESGAAYDMEMQTEPIARAFLEFRAPSLKCSVRSLDTAESGDAYDAEVAQSFGDELEEGSALQTAHRA